MKSFIVEITEFLKREECVYARTAEEAKQIVKMRYFYGNLVLTADDYHGETTFTVKEDT